MRKWSTKLSAQVLAAAASGVFGIGMMSQVFAQDEAEPAAPAAQQATDDAQDGDKQPNDNQPDNAQQDNAATDDAPPADDLNLDDQRVDDSAPPAIPRDNVEFNDRRDNGSNVQRQRNLDDDRISPSDRQLNGVEERGDRNEVRRFDYEDSSQPIPEEHAYGASSHGRTSYAQGCHPCATQRVYHNPCGGCGQSYSQGGSSGYQVQGGQQGNQTRSHNPNRAVIGVTVEDWQDGVQVLSVVPNSPAAQAGMQAGDLIVAIDGRDVRNSQTLMSHIRGLSTGREMSLTIDRAGDRQEIDSQVAVYSQVFGERRSNIASDVPAPPQDRLAQRGQPRTAFRPNYEEAKDDGERLERVQLRIGQLERELNALRQEERDLANASQQDEATDDDADDSADDSTVDEITPPADSPTPADAADEKSEDAVKSTDDSNDSDAADDDTADDEAAPPVDNDQPAAPAPEADSNRERLAPSAR